MCQAINPSTRRLEATNPLVLAKFVQHKQSGHCITGDYQCLLRCLEEKDPPRSHFQHQSPSLLSSQLLMKQRLSASPKTRLPHLTVVEKTIDQVQVVGSGLFDSTQRVFQVVANALKPGIDAALPILQQAGEQALKIASPVISEYSKKAQEAIQSSGIDTEPVLTAAKTVAGAAQQTTKVIEEAKPIASSTVETISSADPVVVVGTAGVLFLAYLLFPPIWSAISFSLRGYQGELTPAQALDLMCTKNHLMIDIRSEKDKDKAGIPRLPSSAKSRMIAIP
ncbi:hypothetical protein L1049_028150 [Liquidambar formosana]|uniref:Uncharacterized protein n=1 Tax=Liquidambar formosana TaxID=63359 RepID=A0AAP0RJY2_LIQFO